MDFSDLSPGSECHFVCTTYCAVHFHALRQVCVPQHRPVIAQPRATCAAVAGLLGILASRPIPAVRCLPRYLDSERSFVQSLAFVEDWAASGGKSGAAFYRTEDERFVIKSLGRAEFYMFLKSALAYFKHMHDVRAPAAWSRAVCARVSASQRRGGGGPLVLRPCWRICTRCW